MNTRIQDMSIDELKAFIDERVDKRLEERFGDPDVGLEVKPEVIEKIRNVRRGKAFTSADEVAQSNGLKW